MRSFLSLLILLCIVYFSNAQPLSVNTSIYNVDQLVQNVLINGCVTASNITYVGTYTGNEACIGYFNAAGTSFAFSSGIIMASGKVSEASGNGGSSASTNLDMGGDSDLDDLLAGFWTTEDAVVIEFDFIPSSDTISFRYIFGSEEYPEYVGSSYNDVFGFFITGPNPSGGNYNSQNIALIPGTTTYVSIDNVNNVFPANPQYYVNNASGTINAYDGHTVPLTATALVIPCQTYHIKLAIADAGDHILDSGVFLEGGSFSSGGNVSMNNPDPVYGSNNDLFEGCSNYYVFSRLDTTDLSDTLEVSLAIDPSSTAVQGNGSDPSHDITTFPTTIQILPGQIYDTIYYQAYTDMVEQAPEGPEFIIITLLSGCTCNMEAMYDTIFLYDDIPFKASLVTPDVKYCNNDAPASLTLEARCQSHPPEFVSFTWSTGLVENGNWTGIFTQSTINIVPTLGLSTYWVTIADLCGNYHTDSVNVIVSQVFPPVSVVEGDLDEGCTGSISLTPAGDSPPFTYAWWSYGLGQALTPASSVTSLCAGNYQVVITDALGCYDTTLFTIQLVSSPVAKFSAQSAGSSGLTILQGSSVQFFDQSQNTPISWNWAFPNGTPGNSTNQNPLITYNTIGVFDVQLMATNEYGNDIISKPDFVTVLAVGQPATANFTANQLSIIEGQSITFSDLSSNSPTYWAWTFQGGTPANSNQQQPPAIFYYTAGTYYVQLIVVNGTGGDTLKQVNYITVLAAATPPQASFSASTLTACIGSTVSFSNSSTNGPTSFQWSFPDANITSSQATNPSGISYSAVGTYPVTLVAINSQGTDTAITNITILATPTVLTDVLPTGCGINSGKAEAQGQDGTPPYSYNWSNGETADFIGSLPAGFIHLTVTDSNGCSVTSAVNIVDTGNVEASIVIDPISCFGGNDATASITVSNGIVPFTYAWYNGSTDSSVTDLNTGVITVTITDSNLCSTSIDTMISQPDSMIISVITDSTSYPTTSDGSATITVTNGIPPFTYVWHNGLSGDVATTLTAGNYYITITDANECVQTSSFFVAAGSGLSVKELDAASGIHIYPNPTKGLLFIESERTLIGKIEVVDGIGKVISVTYPADKFVTLDLTGLAYAMYYIRLVVDNTTYIQTVKLD